MNKNNNSMIKILDIEGLGFGRICEIHHNSDCTKTMSTQLSTAKEKGVELLSNDVMKNSSVLGTEDGQERRSDGWSSWIISFVSKIASETIALDLAELFATVRIAYPLVESLFSRISLHLENSLDLIW
ncbi:hypothetical protein CFP56_042084 [Quercus suber]|uniref:Uncharacterized protein n=1 Tax=Quercus suber TaxID=58331 RepID=A0AAW0M978_QUESU